MSIHVAIAPVHGGLAAPVDRISSIATQGADRLPRIEVRDADRTTLYRIADGTLSPLTGPMGRNDYESVLTRGALERGGKKWAWTIPVVLPVTDAEVRVLKGGAKVALVSEGQPFGTMTVNDVYDWDKARFLATVYGTPRQDHPGARLWLADERSKVVGGELSLAPRVDARPFARRMLSPRETRALITKRGWEQSIALDTRRALGRAQEFALVHGAETLLRENGKRTGAVLSPTVSGERDDDVPPETRVETYEALVSGRRLGEGDKDAALWAESGQDLGGQLELIGLDTRTYHAGPAEAVMQAVYRQNLGYTHFIVGRRQAGASFADGKALWGDRDAQAGFKDLGGLLSIHIVDVGPAEFLEELGRVGLVEEHRGMTVVSTSQARVREQLTSGELPDPRVMRESTARVLIDYYRVKAMNAER